MSIYRNDEGSAVYQRDSATSAALASTDTGKGSSLVGFRQAGLYTVDQTSSDKLGQTVDLRDWIGGNWSEDNDYTGELRNACDECHNATDVVNGGLSLLLPAGQIVISGQIEQGIHALCGHGVTGTTIFWDGDPGEAAFVCNYNNQKFTGLRLDSAATNPPDTWYQLNGRENSPVFDFGTVIEDVFFGKSSGAALIAPNIVNAYLRRCRWSASRSLIEIQGRGLSSWNRVLSMRQCTVDWSSGLPDPGMIEDLVRYTRMEGYAGSSDVFTIALQDWRIEGDSTALADDFAMLRVVGDGLNPRAMKLHMSDIGFDARRMPDGQGGYLTTPSGAAVVRQDTTQTNLLCPIQLENVQFNDLPNWYAGTRLADAYVHVPQAVPTERIPFLSIDTAPVVLPRTVTVGEATISSSTSGLSLSHKTGAGFYTGPGTPEGNVDAPSGSIYRRTNSAGQIFRKASSSGLNTGWIEQVGGQRGNVSGTTDSSGDLIVTHTLGVTPSQVLVSASGNTAYQAQVHEKSTSQLRLRFRTPGGAIAALSSVNADWLAMY